LDWVSCQLDFYSGLTLAAPIRLTYLGISDGTDLMDWQGLWLLAHPITHPYRVAHAMPSISAGITPVHHVVTVHGGGGVW
jgi:hypothetical protein